jgi:hypothetical protein
VSTRRFPWGIYIWALVAIAIFAVSPAIVAIVAGFIQSGAGCGQTGPCLIGGSDWGRGLETAQLAIWLIVFTWPIAGLVFTVWLIALVVHLWRRGKVEGTA